MLRAGLDVWVESEKERRDEKRLGLKALSFVGRCTIYPCCFLFVFLCSQSLASATRSRLSFVRALFSFFILPFPFNTGREMDSQVELRRVVGGHETHEEFTARSTRVRYAFLCWTWNDWYGNEVDAERERFFCRI